MTIRNLSAGLIALLIIGMAQCLPRPDDETVINVTDNSATFLLSSNVDNLGDNVSVVLPPIDDVVDQKNESVNSIKIMDDHNENSTKLMDDAESKDSVEVIPDNTPQHPDSTSMSSATTTTTTITEIKEIPKVENDSHYFFTDDNKDIPYNVEVVQSSTVNNEHLDYKIDIVTSPLPNDEYSMINENTHSIHRDDGRHENNEQKFGQIKVEADHEYDHRDHENHDHHNHHHVNAGSTLELFISKYILTIGIAYLSRYYF